MTDVELLESDQATELLRVALAEYAPDPSQLTVVSHRELTSAVARRRVIGYLVEGLDPTGPSQLIAKSFSESARAELLWTHLQLLSRGGFAVGGFRVPAPLAFLPRESLVLYRACTGVGLNELLDTDGWLEGVRDAARWLAKLHTSAVQLPRTFAVEREAASTHEWAAVVGREYPALLEPARRLAAQWVASGPPARSAEQVPIHKDFHAGHLLMGDSVWVIDLDEARQGDRAFDLAHFCAYLEFHGGRGLAGREAFLSEYAQLTGWADDGSLAWYGAYTWLKVAKQLALRSGPFRTWLGGSSWSVADAVARGFACLAR